MRHFSGLITVATVLALAATSAQAQKSSRSKRGAAPAKSESDSKTADTTQVPQAKVISYSPNELIRVSTRVRYVTLVVLPEGEEILEVACGDKQYWSVTAALNLVYVKPAEQGLKTNLNLVTQSGRIYSFLLTEGPSSVEPDLKVVIGPPAEQMTPSVATGTTSDSAGPAGPVKFVSAQRLEELRRELEAARAETNKAREESAAAVAAGVRKAIGNLRFPYRFEAGKRPFNVRAMGHDERFTYIHARPEEAPVLWEIRDKKPNAVDWTYDSTNGIYVVSRVLGKGYLAIGKARLAFEREE